MQLPDFFGLDIGNSSIKVAEIDRKSPDHAKLVAFSSIPTPPGLINSEDKMAKDRLAGKIKDLLSSSKIKTRKCVAALPEASIFTRLITVPEVDEAKLEELIYWEARQYIPLPLAEVQLDYIPVATKENQGKSMTQLLLVAAPKNLVNRYIETSEMAGLELLALETETIATSRAVTFATGATDPIMVLDFGSNGTDMSVITGGKMIFSQSLSTGSDAMTKAIASDFNLELSQAEQYKVAYGLDKTQAEGKIYKSIEPIIQIIADEVNRTLNFFRTQLTDTVPKMIYMVGDGAKLKGLDQYLSVKTGVTASIINPTEKIEIPKNVLPEVQQQSMVGFTVAIGLGLKIQ